VACMCVCVLQVCWPPLEAQDPVDALRWERETSRSCRPLDPSSWRGSGSPLSNVGVAGRCGVYGQYGQTGVIR